MPATTGPLIHLLGVIAQLMSSSEIDAQCDHVQSVLAAWDGVDPSVRDALRTELRDCRAKADARRREERQPRRSGGPSVSPSTVGDPFGPAADALRRANERDRQETHDRLQRQQEEAAREVEEDERRDQRRASFLSNLSSSFATGASRRATVDDWQPECGRNDWVDALLPPALVRDACAERSADSSRRAACVSDMASGRNVGTDCGDVCKEFALQSGWPAAECSTTEFGAQWREAERLSGWSALEWSTTNAAYDSYFSIHYSVGALDDGSAGLRPDRGYVALCPKKRADSTMPGYSGFVDASFAYSLSCMAPGLGDGTCSGAPGRLSIASIPAGECRGREVAVKGTAFWFVMSRPNIVLMVDAEVVQRKAVEAK